MFVICQIQQPNQIILLLNNIAESDNLTRILKNHSQKKKSNQMQMNITTVYCQQSSQILKIRGHEMTTVQTSRFKYSN